MLVLFPKTGRANVAYSEGLRVFHSYEENPYFPQLINFDEIALYLKYRRMASTLSASAAMIRLFGTSITNGMAR